MSMFNGKRLKIEIFGESHSTKIGVSVSGFPRFKFDVTALKDFLARRKAGANVYSTARKESDEPVFTGVNGDVIDGDFTAEIFNADVKSKDYADLYGKPRPSHADYAWHVKDGTLDFSGGGRFSGRLTAPFCIIGGLCKQYLATQGINVTAYVSSIHGVKGLSYKSPDFCIEKLAVLKNSSFPSLSSGEDMLTEIAAARENLDSVGGVIDCVVTGLKAGVGNDTFDGLEGKISSLIFAVPAVKGVEFGAGFSITDMFGSQANDELYMRDGKVDFYTNNSGGINGGISNGNFLSLSVAVKPTPSIAKPQRTVDLTVGKDCVISIHGRHDACIVPRAVPVVESAVAIALADELLGETL